ncbi:MAG: hypothetical protein KGD57_07790 [Candidatus Lokiarchaeota archaeon]|nr:hypothetical protein [Candidatus Lokiarchaeota archaeon]
MKSEKEKALNARIKEIDSNKKIQTKEVKREIESLKKQIANLEKEKAKEAQQ